MDLSVVIPLFNEHDNIEPLHAETRAALEKLGLGYEIIYVDDGSTDGSGEVLKRIHAADDCVRVVRFSKNFGQTAALAAGLERSRGDIVVTMDGDRQYDPEDIALVVNKLKEGYGLVSGWRKDRKDAFLLRRLPSIIANWIIRRTTSVAVHDYGCMLKAYRGEVARGLRLYGEMHRFIPAIAGDLGATIAEVEVTHLPRRAGVSKYGISRTVRVLLDLVTVKFLSVFATRPLHVFGLLGMALGGPGSLLLLWLGVERIFFGIELGGRPILLLAILLVVTGVQFVTMGLLAEMLARTYHESQDKPIYVVAEDLEARPPRSALAG